MKWQTTCLKCGANYDVDTLLDKCPECKGQRFLSHFSEDKAQYFDIRRDNELIAAGTHFWCLGHLTAVPVDDRSADPRYCQGCYDFLDNEIRQLRENGFTKHPAWVPKPEKIKTQNTKTVPQDLSVNMSIVKSENSTMDIITPQPSKISRRGPQQKNLPIDLINEWAAGGMGSIGISKLLAEQKGIKVSYRTVLRVINGERPLL